MSDRKKRILMIAESHNLSSGFGRYTTEILQRLYDSNKYEIAELCCYSNSAVLSSHPVPWKVYPNAPEPNESEEGKKAYNDNPINQFGQWRFERVVLHFKPDIVCDIRDYWMFAYQELSPLRKYFHWIIAPTIDSIPQRQEWLHTFENADVLLTHTDWAYNYIKSLNRPINLLGVVSDSVDTKQFCPITHTKAYHKAKYGIPTDSIVLGSVMRNQKRKLIPALFSMLSKLIEKTNNRKIYLHLHTSYPENSGWNIPELLQEYGVYNNVLFTYYVPDNGTVFVSPYKGALIPCPNDASKTACFPGVVKGLPNEKLVEIYNLFDIYIQYAICEGLGIPQLEAASCGIPIMAVNYSGMEEITTKVEGVKISHTLSKELETGSDRAIPDDDCLVNEIISWMSLSPSQKKEKSKRTRALLIDHYGWDKTANEWMRIFDTLEPKNIWDQPMVTHHETKVPDNLTARQFITYIVQELMEEPLLLKTYFVQSLIRSVDEKFSNVGGHISEVAIQQVVKTLEVSLNNKMICEQLRSGVVPLSESYLVCDNK